METVAVSWNSTGPCQIKSPGEWKKSPKYLQEKQNMNKNHTQAQEGVWAMVGDNLDGEFKTTSKCLKERAEDSSPKHGVGGW